MSLSSLFSNNNSNNNYNATTDSDKVIRITQFCFAQQDRHQQATGGMINGA